MHSIGYGVLQIVFMTIEVCVNTISLKQWHDPLDESQLRSVGTRRDNRVVPTTIFHLAELSRTDLSSQASCCSIFEPVIQELQNAGWCGTSGVVSMKKNSTEASGATSTEAAPRRDGA